MASINPPNEITRASDAAPAQSTQPESTSPKKKSKGIKALLRRGASKDDVGQTRNQLNAPDSPQKKAKSSSIFNRKLQSNTTSNKDEVRQKPEHEPEHEEVRENQKGKRRYPSFRRPKTEPLQSPSPVEERREEQPQRPQQTREEINRTTQQIMREQSQSIEQYLTNLQDYQPSDEPPVFSLLNDESHLRSPQKRQRHRSAHAPGSSSPDLLSEKEKALAKDTPPLAEDSSDSLRRSWRTMEQIPAEVTESIESMDSFASTNASSFVHVINRGDGTKIGMRDKITELQQIVDIQAKVKRYVLEFAFPDAPTHYAAVPNPHGGGILKRIRSFFIRLFQPQKWDRMVAAYHQSQMHAQYAQARTEARNQIKEVEAAAKEHEKALALEARSQLPRGESHDSLVSEASSAELSGAKLDRALAWFATSQTRTPETHPLEEAHTPFFEGKFFADFPVPKSDNASSVDTESVDTESVGSSSADLSAVDERRGGGVLNRFGAWLSRTLLPSRPAPLPTEDEPREQLLADVEILEAPPPQPPPPQPAAQAPAQEVAPPQEAEPAQPPQEAQPPQPPPSPTGSEEITDDR